MTEDPELLIEFSDGELEALADGVLSPTVQKPLDELLARNAEGALSAPEQAELDRLLDQVDHLTTVKTRARYTLHQRVARERLRSRRIAACKSRPLCELLRQLQGCVNVAVFAPRDEPFEFDHRIVENLSWQLEVKCRKAHHAER